VDHKKTGFTIEGNRAVGGKGRFGFVETKGQHPEKKVRCHTRVGKGGKRDGLGKLYLTSRETKLNKKKERRKKTYG